LYTFLGISMKYSIIVFLITLVFIIVISFFNYRKWNKQISS
jgi:cbb3-type cytochrome oxidase subunit 3